jgi:iduronate 2-sulfatase
VPFAWAATDNADADEPDGITARKVVKLLEEHREGPFFIAAGFHRPHIPHTAPTKYFDMYPPESMKLPVEPTGHTQGIPEIARPPKYHPELTAEQARHIISHYLAASTFMDSQVGVLLEAMDRLKLWDNTVVVFVGDHGWHHGEHGGFWAKSSLMKESARSPFIVHAPGKQSRASCSRMIEFIDLFPTFAELCGLPTQAGLEGKSFVPLLDDPQRSWKEAAYSVVTRGKGARKNALGRGVYSERWTYLAWPDGSEQLYDYAADPKEYNNLAGDSQYASVLAEMKTLLQKAPHSMELSK